MAKPTTGKHSVKKYECTACGAVEKHGTNHWGDIYPRCRSCGWKRPMGQTFTCLEPCPETHDKPQSWKVAKLATLLK